MLAVRDKVHDQFSSPPSRLAPRAPRLPFRPALTLIELLVSIVILVTVLGAVIPVISPNNDARRIRSAARQVQSMLAQAQALAAREGRPYGVAFAETGIDQDGDGVFDDVDGDGAIDANGTGLEVFFISEPQPYAGLSENSRVRLKPSGQGPTDPVDMQFVLAGAPTGQPFPNDLPDDQFPPNLVRRGDRVEVGGVVYRLVSLNKEGDGNDLSEANFPEGDFYSLNNLQPAQEWRCVVESSRPPLPVYANGYTTPRPYRILRQASNPATRPGNTSAPPLAMPRNVGIDVVASGPDVIFPDPALALSPQFGFTTWQSDKRTALINDGNFYPFVRPLTVGIMFAPSGRVDHVWINGERLKGPPDRIHLLVGRAENSLRSPEERAADADFSGFDPPGDPASDAELLERRQRVNWLNGDSLWVTVGSRTGRVVASDNSISSDPRAYGGDNLSLQVAKQIRDARDQAAEMTGGARQ